MAKNIEENQNLNEITLDIKRRMHCLVNILTKELESTTEFKSLQGGGYKSAKRAIKLLIQLHRETQACQLYLTLCSAILKARLRKVKRESSTSCYVKELCSIAFSNIVEISQDFLNIFFPTTNYTSGNFQF